MKVPYPSTNATSGVGDINRLWAVRSQSTGTICTSVCTSVMSGAWATPGAYVYIHRLLHRLGLDTGNHYQLSFGATQWVTDMSICGWGHCLCLYRGGRYIYSPSLNDKGDKNDKESEKSPMRVIGRGLWKPCHCCHSCHGRRVVLSENFGR